MATNVGELQVTIGTDISKLEAGFKKALANAVEFAKNITTNANAINAGFGVTERSINLIEGLLKSKGIAPTKEAIVAVKRALKQIEKEEKEAQKQAIEQQNKAQKAMDKLRKDYNKTQEKNEKDYNEMMYRIKRAHKKRDENEEKRHTKELEKQAKEREKTATNAGIYGGLFGGITVGGRLGFAGGYFTSRLGTRAGGVLGAGIGRGIGRFFGQDNKSEEEGGRKGGNIGGMLGGFGTFATIMPMVYVGQKLYDLMLATIGKIWEGMKAVAAVTWQAVKAAFNLGLEYEKASLTFEVMLGSQEKGKKLYEDIEKLAIKSPYRTSKLVGPAQTLLGAGVQDDNIIPVLSRIGDIAGGDYDRMNRLIKAFTDVMAKGVLQGEERRQFGNVGIGLKDFAETVGMNEPKFQRAMRAGEIDYNVVVETVNRLTSKGGRFHGLSNRVATETVGGALEAIQETFEQFGSRLGRNFFSKFEVGKKLNEFLGILDNFDFSQIEAWMQRAADGLSNLGKYFNIDVANNFFTSFIEKIRSFLPEWTTVGKTIEDGLVKWFPSLVDGFKLAATAGIGFVEVLVKISNAIGKILGGMVKWIPGIETTNDTKVMEHKVRMLRYAEKPDEDFLDFRKQWLWNKGISQKQYDANPEMRLKFIADYQKSLKGPQGINITELEKEIPGADTILKTLEGIRKFIDDIERPHMGNIKAMGNAFAVKGALFGGLGVPIAGGRTDEEPNLIRRGRGRLPLEVRNLVEDLEKQSIKGFTDFEQFGKTQKNLRMARFGTGALPGEITDQEYQFGLAKSFQELAKGLNKVGERLPQTQYYGSSEAQATINNAIVQNQTKSIQEQILQVLGQAKNEATRQTEYNRIMADALVKIANKNQLEEFLQDPLF